ncbi:MAG: hypothetical protein MI975_01470 [Cytophagales bacterium]|nr:hypothetical protein [Cytophagales bacterium]
MKPIISTSVKGEIRVENRKMNYDFYININGKIIKRDPKFLHQDHSAMQSISLIEASKIYDPNINEMIIGWDKNDHLALTNEATDFFEEKRCKIKLLPLKEAITYWNRYEGHAIGLFHIQK